MLTAARSSRQTTTPTRVFTVPDDCSTDDNEPIEEDSVSCARSAVPRSATVLADHDQVGIEEQDDAPQPSQASIPQLDGVVDFDSQLVDLTSELSDAESEGSLDEDNVQAGRRTGDTESVTEPPARLTTFRFVDAETSSSRSSRVELYDPRHALDYTDAYGSPAMWDSMSSTSEDDDSISEDEGTDVDEEAAFHNETQQGQFSAFGSDSDSEDDARDGLFEAESSSSASPSPERPTQHGANGIPQLVDTGTNKNQSLVDDVQWTSAKVSFLSEQRERTETAPASDQAFAPISALSARLSRDITEQLADYLCADDKRTLARISQTKTDDTTDESANGKQIATGFHIHDNHSAMAASHKWSGPAQVNHPRWDIASAWGSQPWQPSSAWEFQQHKRFNTAACCGCEACRTRNFVEPEATSSEQPSDSSHPILGEATGGSQSQINDEEGRSSTKVQTKDNGKRKAELISTMDNADLQWTSSATAADVTTAPATPSTSTTNVQSQLPSPPTSPQDTASPEARPAKKMKKIAERVGFAALGGATVGAMVLTTLIYSAPTFT